MRERSARRQERDAARHDLEAFQQELAKLSENDNFDATIHVIENDELQRRYDYAIETDNPSINYKISLTGIRYMYYEVAGTPVLIAALPLKECLKLPVIKDGTLFHEFNAKDRWEGELHDRVWNTALLSAERKPC